MLATVREGVAIARGDDAAIGEAKSEHAEAMLAAHDRAERRRADEQPEEAQSDEEAQPDEEARADDEDADADDASRTGRTERDGRTTAS